MSIEFNAQGFPGWFQDDPNKPTILRANVATLRSKSGGIAPIVAEINYADGSIQYYDIRGGIGFNGPRIPLFTQNASGTRTVQNQGNLNELKPEDIARIESSVKNVAFRANQSLATTPQKEALRNSPYYQSLGNSTPPTPQGDQQGGNPQTSTDGSSGTQNPAPTTLPTPEEAATMASGAIDLTPPSGSSLKAAQLKIVKGGRLQYPLKMSAEQDKIKFTAVKIKPKKPTDDPSLGFSFGIPEYERVDGPVFLAIQAPISDQNSVEWGPDNVNAIDASLFKLSYNAMGDKTIKEITNDLDAVLKNVYAEVGYQQERIKRALAGQAASLNNVLSRTDGVILNPNLELLFQAPQLRPFTFQFKMTAREPNEAVAIKRIIKYFKYHMAVRKENSALFLRAPHVFTIQYMKGESPQHPGINLISPSDEEKACALTNCSVDYTPLGTYMTNIDDPDPEKNGTMVAYTLSLQFQEIAPIYDTDYNEYENHPIGF